MDALSPSFPVSVAKAGSAGNRAGWVLCGLCLLLLVPLALVEVLPLADYPNHLARLFILASADPVLDRFYAPHWTVIPNLGLDLIGVPLLWLLPVHVAGRLIAGLALLAPVLGAAAYHRALTGRLSYWPLGAALFAYNGAFLRGFLNFELALGLALLCGAVWIAWREARPAATATIAAAGAVALFFCHLTGLIFFAILAGAYEAAQLRSRRPPIAAIVRRVLVFGIVFALPAVLYILSDLSRTSGAVLYRTPAGKAAAALMPVINYVWPLDLLTAVLCIAAAAVCLAWRTGTIPFQARLALFALLVLFLAAPNGFKGTFDLDTRFIMMAAFLAPAAIVGTGKGGRIAALAPSIFLALFAVRLGVVSAAFLAWRPELAAFRAVIAPVPPGAVVLTVRGPSQPGPIIDPRQLSDGARTDGHLPALLAIERRAWWPYLFDNQSQQPIASRDPYSRLAALIDSAPDPLALTADRGILPGLLTHALITGAVVTGPWPLEILARQGDVTLLSIDRSVSRIETIP